MKENLDTMTVPVNVAQWTMKLKIRGPLSKHTRNQSSGESCDFSGQVELTLLNFSHKWMRLGTKTEWLGSGNDWFEGGRELRSPGGLGLVPRSLTVSSDD